MITVIDNRTQEEFNYTPNSKNGSFVITLVPGSYTVLIDAPGFSPKNETIFIKGKSDFIPFMTQEFVVNP